MVIFGIMCPKRVYRLSDFFYTKFGFWEGVFGSHPHAKFHHCGLKMWEYSPQKRKIFTKFGLGEGVPGLHSHANFHRAGCKNVGLEPPKSQKNGNG